MSNMTYDDLKLWALNLPLEEQLALVEALVGALRREMTVGDDAPVEWSDDELAELLTPEPMTGAEIVAAGLTGGWADQGIPDGAAWVEAQRRKRRERHQW